MSKSASQPFSIRPFLIPSIFVFDDVDMEELVASIKANGLLKPIVVRNKADGRYEVISGHRRKRAYEILKINEIRAIVVNGNDNEAVILMVDSNCQRSKILPSEKAFSYKMKLDAIKRQGEQTGESAAQVARYIRLTNLVPELLEFVDSGRMKMQPAIELSLLHQSPEQSGSVTAYIAHNIRCLFALPIHGHCIFPLYAYSCRKYARPLSCRLS